MPRAASRSRCVAPVLVALGACTTAAAGGLPLSSLGGALGFRLDGAAPLDLTGQDASAAGDLDGDGVADLLVSAINAAPGGTGSGACYIVFGRRSGFPAALALSLLDGTDGFVCQGAASGDFAGISVGAAGDVNGDGLDDIVIGAYAADPNGASSGQSYVVFGTTRGFPAALDLGELDGTDGFALNGATIFERSGRSVAGAGDFNGDSVGDLIIGALNADAPLDASGKAYVVFGSRAGFPPELELGRLDGSTGFTIHGTAAGDHAGTSVGGGLDFNGDGFDDVVIGAPEADTGALDSGAAYLLLGTGAPMPAVVVLSSLDGVLGFALLGDSPGDLAGISVAGAGDLDADGLDDLVVGAAGADAPGTDAGAAYVVLGTRRLPGPALALAALDGSDGFVIRGAAAGDRTGIDASAAGDFDGDGFGDVLVGAEDASGGAGGAYLVFGRGDGFGPAVDLAALDATAGIALSGAAAGDGAGASVSGAGDVDGDGSPDLLIGAPGADPAGSLSGAAYAVFGTSADCNANGVLDLLDLACGTSLDLNYNGRPDECDPDQDGDGDVGIDDLVLLLGAWGPCPAPPEACPADLDGDGQAGITDLIILLAAWG